MVELFVRPASFLRQWRQIELAKIKNKQTIRIVTLTEESHQIVAQILDQVVDEFTGENRVNLLKAIRGLSTAIVVDLRIKPE